MSVLIVDDEQSRVPLSAMLRALGHREIRETPDWLQAIKLVEGSRTRFRLVIASHQANGLRLLGELRSRRAYDSCAFILTTSDDGIAERRDLGRTWTAREALLDKPFSRRDLAKAIESARMSRNFARDAILCVTGASTVDAVRRALVDAWPAHWREVIHAPTAAIAAQQAEALGWRVGAVLVDPPSAGEAELRWVRRFGTSVLGGGCVIASLGNRGAQILPLREICDRFVPLRADESRLELWHEALSSLSTRCLSGWQLHDGIQEGRDAFRDGNSRLARTTVARMLAIDSYHAEAQCLLAEMATLDGRTDEGIRLALEALDANPCLPRAYMLLLSWIPLTDQKLRARVALDAATYCPQHPQVLGMLGKAA